MRLIKESVLERELGTKKNEYELYAILSFNKTDLYQLPRNAFDTDQEYKAHLETVANKPFTGLHANYNRVNNLIHFKIYSVYVANGKDVTEVLLTANLKTISKNTAFVYIENNSIHFNFTEDHKIFLMNALRKIKRRYDLPNFTEVDFILSYFI